MKRNRAKILCFLTCIPRNTPFGMNSKTELKPGPTVIPRELMATKIAEYLL